MLLIKNIFNVIYSLRRTVMKFAKKILVGIVAVALLVSCLALSTSAEAPTRPVKDFKSVLEYRELATYLIEDYEGYAEGAFTFDGAASALVKAQVFDYLAAEGSSQSVVADGDDKVLAVTTTSGAPVGYKFLAEGSDDLLPRIIISFDFKSGDGTVGGSDISVLATLPDYFEDVPLFSASLSGENKSFTYATYDMARVTYSTATAEVAPELNTWYTVDIIYDLVNGEYSIAVSSGDEVVFSYSNPIFRASGIDSVRFYTSNPAETTGITYIDDLVAYEGSFLRNVTDPENSLAELLLAIDAYAKDPLTSIEEKLEVAEAYDVIYAKYTIPEDIEKYDEVKAVVDDAPGFKNRTLAAAFINEVNTLAATEGYYAKIDYRDAYVDHYYAMYPSDSVSDYERMAGLKDAFDEERSYAEAIVDAKELYASIDFELTEIKSYSENFAKQLEDGYDPSTDNYEVMVAKYNLLSLTASKIDLGYRYKDVNPDTKYPTLESAYNEYLALESRIAAIEENVRIFIPAVLAMDTTEVESVSAEQPFLTADFETLLENYLIASSVYSDGSVHEFLDPTTFTGDVDLVELIAEFEVKKAYIDARIAECNTFVSIINGAYASTYFVTVVSELERAALYFDENKEYSLEKYTGVEDAIATYSLLLARVEKNKADAAAYIAAVNAIDMEAGYAAVRAAVDAAVLLQADGSVTGIEGVEAAEIKLAEALSYVESLEGYSSTLIAAVEGIKDAKTLAEKRALIYLANSVKDKAESSISGVSAAKTELSKAIAAYNAEVEALNALFSGVVSDASSVISAVAADQGAANAAEAIDKLN